MRAVRLPAFSQTRWGNGGQAALHTLGYWTKAVSINKGCNYFKVDLYFRVDDQ